eukprot:1514469-Alexandrium_andersonii.AAC.1
MKSTQEPRAVQLATASLALPTQAGRCLLRLRGLLRLGQVIAASQGIEGSVDAVHARDALAPLRRRETRMMCDDQRDV